MTQDNQDKPNIIQTSETLINKYKTEIRLEAETINRIKEIRDEAIENSLTQHRCHKAVIAGIGLLACREQNVPRVAADFAKITQNDGKDITQHQVSQQSKRIKRELNIKITPTKTEEYLTYYGEELNLNEETMLQARQMLKTAKETGLADRPAPTTLAAGIIDAARRITNDENVVQSDIERVSHVTATQFREYCQEIQTA